MSHSLPGARFTFRSSRPGIWLLTILVLTGCLSGNNQAPDPTVSDLVIAYVKRPVTTNEMGQFVEKDARELLTFIPGGDLFIKKQASPSAREINITDRITSGRGDVRDIEIASDGKTLLFSLHMPLIEGADDEDQPKWGLWEYSIDSDQLARVIASDNIANAGNDIAPHYLPDGRIVFSSTRQRGIGATLLDEGKPQYPGLDEDLNEEALVLHVLNAARDDIVQISFNQSHDLDPIVLQNGKIMFSRWDNAGARSQMSLYSVNPDGTNLELVYGAHSHGSGTSGAIVQFLQPRELPNGKIVVILRPYRETQGGGDISFIDTENYIDIDKPTFTNERTLNDPGQVPATGGDIRTDGTLSPNGRFASAYPLWDGTGRILVSWSQCRVQKGDRIAPCTAQDLSDPAALEAKPLYGIFLYDGATHTQRPVVAPVEGIEITDVVAAQDRALAEIIFDSNASNGLSQAYIDKNVGVLHIRSVYDFDGAFNALDQDPTDSINFNDLNTIADVGTTTADQRSARFIRIVKAVPIPEDMPEFAFGPGGELMREIVGYSMIEPDGSVMVQVPANVPIALEVLDKNARRITPRHSNWIQLKSGETRECNGCHNHTLGRAHGREDGTPPVNPGATTSGVPFTNASSAVIPELGETMAATRARVRCTPNCGAAELTIDVEYSDIWTESSFRTPDASFSYAYADVDTLSPQSLPYTINCVSWNYLCRIIINYESHIHPLWSKTRQTLDSNGNVVLDQTCTRCHNTRDINNVLQVPAGQLDLSNGASDDEADHLRSYRELLFSDNEQQLLNGTLQDILVQTGVDQNGNPIMAPVPVLPSMSGNGATASAFFETFNVQNDTNHFNALNSAELRFISEWLDIGAQYFNNPFAVPVN